MPLKPIVTIPDPVLRKISEPVEKLTNEELKLIKDLEDTMYEANGIGLASIQVGIPKRIVVIDVSKDAKIKKPNYFINPVIKSFSNETSGETTIDENQTNTTPIIINKEDLE